MARFVPALGSAAAPVPSDRPAHATPDVHPVTPEAAPAKPEAAPEAAAVRVEAAPAQAQAAPEAAAAQVESAPAQAQAAPEADAGTPALPPRVRGGSPPIEVSHGEPIERPAPPAPAPAPPAPLPPASPALAWPVPARPLRPAPPAPQASADPSPVSVAATTESGDKSDADQAAPVAPQVPVVKAAADNQERELPSIERALSGPSEQRDLSWHGRVKIVAGGTPGPGAQDQEALDRTRARLPLRAPMRVLMLGCTGGAGQSLTTLMTGYILASLREHPVAAVDLHDGTLARYSQPAGLLEEILLGKPPRSQLPARPDGLHPARMTAPAKLDVIASHDTLRDGDEIKLAAQLGRYYPLTMLDPGASGLTKLLKITDQLVIVVPASVEAAGALADTRDWLDAHGFADLAGNSVTLINGVSRRSLGDVEQAESVARGRCRAIVRVPWDEMLPSGLTSPDTLRAQTRVAYTALAGVLVAGMAAAPVRTQQ
jgi:MinD-like ATPase involved in chromosome partitioning or flagellar assembly